MVKENEAAERGEDLPPVVQEETKKKKKKKKKRSNVDEEMQDFIASDDESSSGGSSSEEDDEQDATNKYTDDEWKNLKLMHELFIMDEEPWLRAIKAAKGLYDPKVDQEQIIDEDQTDFNLDTGRDDISKQLALLREQYEPSERAKHFVTEFDDRIRRADKPERLYIRNLRKGRTNIDWDDVDEVKTERSLEANWIFYKMKEEGSLGELADNTETKRVTISCIQKF